MKGRKSKKEEKRSKSERKKGGTNQSRFVRVNKIRSC